MFWGLLESYMASRGINARTFAIEVGVSTAVVSRWKQGTRPSVANINKIAMQTGIDRGEMLKAAGYDLPASPDVSYPGRLREVLDQLTSDELGVIEATAHGLLRLRKDRAEGIEPPREDSSPGRPLATRGRPPKRQ